MLRHVVVTLLPHFLHGFVFAAFYCFAHNLPNIRLHLFDRLRRIHYSPRYKATCLIEFLQFPKLFAHPLLHVAFFVALAAVADACVNGENKNMEQSCERKRQEKSTAAAFLPDV